MWTDDEIKGKILHKLVRRGKFKHSHTSIDLLPKGFPKDMRGRVRSCANDLLKEEILLSKPTSYGVEVSIDPDKLERIMHYIELFLEKE